MTNQTIDIINVRQHNLKGFDLSIPLGKITVLTEPKKLNDYRYLGDPYQKASKTPKKYRLGTKFDLKFLRHTTM